MANNDRLGRALDDARQAVAAEQLAAQERGTAEERRLASRARDLEQLGEVGSSFVVRARQAGIAPEPVIFHLKQVKGRFRKRIESGHEKRLAWVVRHYHSPRLGYGEDQPGIYVFESGEVYYSLGEGRQLTDDVDGAITACARYLAERGA